MDTVKLIVNGTEVEARPGQTILEVVREHGLDDIPTLCHSPELEPYGSCFVCVVEVKGRPVLVPSCATRVTAGMEVETRNERVRASRKTALELLLSNHYADCVSPCKLGCPAGVDVQGYLALASMGETRKAVDLIRESNPLPAVCGRVCVRKCEAVCRRADVDSPVGINAVKRYLTDAPGVYDGQVERGPLNGKSVGIVGGGPAGLSAAWFLGRRGYAVTVYEAMEKAGGMVRYGIPEYRLPDEVLDREIDFVARAGVEIRTGVKVGRDIPFDELRHLHDAVFVAAGAWASNPMKVEGEFTTAGVVGGIEFLREKYHDRSPISGTVVVVGGGNTAMDVARTAWRLGADKVILLYRRTKAEMPADPMEIEDALHEGVEIMELAAPVGIGAVDGRLSSLRCIRMKLGEPDSSGRRRPVPMEGSEFDLPCDLAVAAIGQSPLLEGLAGAGGLPGTTKWGTVSVDTATMKTDVEGVFAGGDAADDGPTVVIDAIADGRTAALSIHAFLGGGDPPHPFIVRKDMWSKPGKAELGDIAESPRHEVHMLPVAEREGSFCEVATGFEWEDVLHEGAKCLSCGCLRYDDCELRLRAEEYGADVAHYAGHVRRHRPDDRHPHILYDPNKCVLCGRCIRTCARVLPVAALGLVGRGFRTEMRPAMNDPLVETNCVSCGNCVDACPTGALTVRLPYPGRACLEVVERATRCSVCSIQCPVRVMSHGSARYYITSSGVPGDYLCRSGRFANELYISSRRISAPSVRRGVETVVTDACSAVREAVTGLRKAAAEYGPGAVAVFVSAESTIEEMHLASRIAREGLGTGNIGSIAASCSSYDPAALDGMLGFTASTAGREALAQADLVICSNTSLEGDHPVLAVDILEAVRKRGAGLVVVNSALDDADRILSHAVLDPVRGTASVLWAGIVRRLAETGSVTKEAVASVPGGGEFLSSLGRTFEEACATAGVDPGSALAAVEAIAGASRIVIIHTPDRARDRARGDLEILAGLAVLANASGRRADILLPRVLPNGAALEVAGASPAFLPGRRQAGEREGHPDLARALEDGSIRAALVIGEDPLGSDRTATWFRNVEFLAALDWASTETTRAAGVVLPGSTGLEGSGTRLDFTGSAKAFSRAVAPPAGIGTAGMLAMIAGECGISADLETIGTTVRKALEAGSPGVAGFYWNDGVHPVWDGKGRLGPVETGLEPGRFCPPLTVTAQYRAGIAEVGNARYRVQSGVRGKNVK